MPWPRWPPRSPAPSGPVIWIGAQECTGCTESLLRATHPTIENLILNTISLEYHEVLSAAFGHQAEENKHNAIERYKGKYVLVVDGSIPLKDGGIYCMVAGEPIVDHIRRAAADAAAVIAIGSCAAWGGVPASGGNPTGAVSLEEALGNLGTPIINIPGCPPNPTTSSPRSPTTSPTASCRRSMPRSGRCLPMSGSSTKTASAARTSMPAASPRSLATRATVRAGVSTILAARGRRPTATARPWSSATWAAASGRWVSAIPATAATSREWVSARDLPARQGGESHPAGEQARRGHPGGRTHVAHRHRPYRWGARVLVGVSLMTVRELGRQQKRHEAGQHTSREE